MARELLFSRSGGRYWAATREEGEVVELRVEDEHEPLGAGRVVLGRVSRVLPGIQSAFVDVGRARDAFLHGADVVLPGESPDALEEERPDDDEDDEGGGDPRPRRSNAPRGVPIEARLAEGMPLVVQVAREAISTKGARVTCFVSIPGRYLVYTPQWAFLGVSRKILDPAERQRLREVLETLPRPGGGFIVRTAGEGRSAEALRADAAGLVESWGRALERARRAKPPAVVHDDLELPFRILRDTPRDGVDRIAFDDPELYERARAWLEPLEPALAAKLRPHLPRGRLFEAEGIDLEIDRALRPKVWLKSGGTIVIQQTEALVSIDVNTGKFVGKRGPEETVLRTNLEAAAEIARQLRLRDLGGIIVVDFIDMDRADSRRLVLEALEAAMRRDKSRTKIVGLSDLGLVQLTRKRTRPGLEAALTEPCPTCHGHGRVKSPATLAGEAIAEARRVGTAVASLPVTVRAHPAVARAVRLAIQEAGEEIEPEIAALLRVEEDAAARPDAFDVVAG